MVGYKVGYPVKINGTTAVLNRPGFYWIEEYPLSVFNRTVANLDIGQKVIIKRGKFMNGDEIFERLKASDRWGTNDQPSIYWVTGILEQLPVKEITVQDDRLQVTFSRDLSSLEHWAILSLNANSLTQDRESRLVDLWWD